jgi:hypothetical protein
MDNLIYNLIKAARNNYSKIVKNILNDNNIDINEMYGSQNTYFSKMCYTANLTLIKLIVSYKPNKYSLSMGIRNISIIYNNEADPIYDYPNYIRCCNVLIKEANGDLDLIKPYFIQFFRDDDLEIFKIDFPDKYNEFKKLIKRDRFNL